MKEEFREKEFSKALPNVSVFQDDKQLFIGTYYEDFPYLL